MGRSMRALVKMPNVTTTGKKGMVFISLFPMGGKSAFVVHDAFCEVVP
jgi:hypothetical protein